MIPTSIHNSCHSHTLLYLCHLRSAIIGSGIFFFFKQYSALTISMLQFVQMRYTVQTEGLNGQLVELPSTLASLAAIGWE